MSDPIKLVTATDAGAVEFAHRGRVEVRWPEGGYPTVHVTEFNHCGNYERTERWIPGSVMEPYAAPSGFCWVPVLRSGGDESAMRYRLDGPCEVEVEEGGVTHWYCLPRDEDVEGGEP